MTAKPFISIIIPCRNEEKYIGQCLDSVISNDYPKDRLEVFVVDGASSDSTKKIIEGYLKQFPFIKLLENPKKIVPSAMNIGIAAAAGEIIMKIDGHAQYQKDYISKCVKYLGEYGADNVGGTIIALPRNKSLVGRGIARSLSTRFGAGDSLFRVGIEKPTWADTAFSGCYKKEVFKKIDLYDESIARSEDVAVNSRLIKAGGKILLAPDIVSRYYARSDLKSFMAHNFDNGFWITYPLKFKRAVFSLRHIVPLVFVLSLSGILGLRLALQALNVSRLLADIALYGLVAELTLYLAANLYFSATDAIKEKDIRFLAIQPVIYLSLHIAYGLGSIWGIINLMIPIKNGGKN